MIEPRIELLFPTPVMFTELNREFTKNEINFVKKHSQLSYSSPGAVTVSKNKYILNEPELANLHKYITEAVNIYCKKVYKPKYDNELFITQSWFNWLKPGDFHHKHTHQNSFISGVLYIDTDENIDKINFVNERYNQLQLETDTFDVLNSNSWWFNVKIGDIIMFPSSLVHGVDETPSDKTRISLAFNTFIKGTIGDYQSCNELIY